MIMADMDILAMITMKKELLIIKLFYSYFQRKTYD